MGLHKEIIDLPNDQIQLAANNYALFTNIELRTVVSLS